MHFVALLAYSQKNGTADDLCFSCDYYMKLILLLHT